MTKRTNRLQRVALDARKHKSLNDVSEATQNLHRLAVLVIEIRRKAQAAKGVAPKRCQAYNKATLL